MDRKFVIALSSLAGSVFLSEAYAVGLGEIRVRSNLNEPLRADIQLVQAKDLSEAQLLVNLASDADFARAGVDRDFLLNSLRFRVDLDDPRNPRIVVTTQQPVREPFLNFLVELQWPSGRLLREYTVLMDLPAFAGTAPSAVSRPQAAPPVVQPIPYDEGVRPVERPARAAVAKPVAKPAASTPKAAKPAAKPAAKQTAVKSQPAPKATVKHDGASYGPTKNNDTLWSIAKSLNNGGNVHQNMIAIQRMNPDAFVNGNINKMKQGQVLALPGQAQVAQISKADAIAEVQNHNAAWKTGKRPEQVVGAQINATDRAPAQKASTAKQDGQLKLATPSDSKQGKAGQGGGDGHADVAKLQNDLAVSLEELNRHQRTRDELSSRVQSLDSQLDNAEKLLSLQSNELAKLQGTVADKQAAEQPATAVQAAVGEAGVAEAAGADAVNAEEAAKAEALAKEEAAKAEQVAAEEAAKAEALAKEEAAKAEQVAAEEAAKAEALAKEEAAKAEQVAAEDAAKAEAQAKEEAAKAEQVAAEEAAKAEALAKETAAETEATAGEQAAEPNALVDAQAADATATETAPANDTASPEATDAAAVAAAAQAEQQAQADKAKADEAASAEAAKAEQAAADAKAKAEQATAKAKTEKTQPAPVAEEKPFWQNWPLVGGAAALLLGLMAWRRRQVQKADEEVAAYEAPYTPAVEEEAPVEIEQPVEEVALVEEVVAAEPVVEEVLPETGDVLGEADIFISFGSYDKAAALLASAIAREPHRPDYRLKQLELFKEQGDLAAFDQANAELRNLNNDSANFKATELRAMIPGAAAVAATYAAAQPDLSADLIDEFTSDTQSLDAAADDIAVELDFDSDADLLASELATELPETAAAPLNLDDEGLDLSFDQVDAPALDLDDLALDLSFDAPAEDSADEIALRFDEPAAAVTDSAETIALEDLGLDLGLDTDSAPALLDTADDNFLNFDDASLADASFTEADAASAELIAELNAAESLDVELDLADAGLGELALDSASAQDAPQLGESSAELAAADLGLDDLGLDLDLGDNEALSGVAPSGDIDEDLNFLADADEAATKLDLARAYIDMGDSEGARDILGEVLEEGTAAQKADAQALIDSLG